MLTNDLKKGDRVQLRNGWYATILDNKKGNTRVACVEGDFTESGSVYSHDIAYFSPPDNDGESFVPIVHTPAQLKLKSLVESIF